MIKLPENFLRIFIRSIITILALAMLIFFGNKIYNSKCLISESCDPIYLSNLLPKSRRIDLDYVKIKVDVKVIDRYQYLDLTTDETSFTVRGDELQYLVFKVKNNDKRRSARYKLKTIISDNKDHHIVIYNCCNNARKIKPSEEQVNKLIFKFDDKLLERLYWSSPKRTNQEYTIYYELVKI